MRPLLVVGMLSFFVTIAPCAAQAKAKKVLVNFEGTPLIRVVKWMSQKTAKNFIVEDALRDRRITIISGSRVTVEEAYEAFLTALDAEALSIVEDGKFFKITAGARGSSRASRADISMGDCPFPAGIREVNETSWSIERAEYDRWMEKLNCLAMQARIVPHLVEGKAEGFKIFAIRPSSLYAKLGIRNGDVIQKINDTVISSPDKALEVYLEMKEARDFTVGILRRGKERKHTYRIE